MDLIIYFVCSLLAIFFTFLGLRYVEISFLNLIFNVAVIGSVAVTGLSSVVGLDGATVVETTYDIGIVLLIQVLYCCISLFAILDWRSG